MTTALVIGGAACQSADLATLDGMDFAFRIGINNAAYAFPDLDCACSLHPEHVPGWKAKRTEAGFQPIEWVSFHEPRFGVTVWQPEPLDAWTRGSSSLYATGYALTKVDHVVLAGCPMDDTPNIYRDETRWAPYQRYRLGWQKMLPLLKGRVTSCSGWTAAELGTP